MGYDKLVKRILQRYKCRRCGRCCSIPPMIDPVDVQRISTHLGISKKMFVDVYTVARTEGKPYLTNPCPFYKDNICEIYPIRPKVCRFFPFQVDAPIIFAMDWCEVAKRITRDIMKMFPTLMNEKIPEFLKIRQKVIDAIAPKINTKFLQGKTRGLAVPIKQLRELLRR